ncbi:MAG: hypothetical protein FWB75_00740 [Oscillospiraceae bacterium]|nr:hypothetical protein [Oscillospiraceae bacterium]
MNTNNAVFTKLKEFVFEYKVVLLFLLITAGAFWAAGMSTVMFFSELFTRIGRNLFLVLALLIPVVAGLGLNFAVGIGAMSAQIALFLIILWGGQGLTGIMFVALLSIPIAVFLGYIVGKLFNKMKGAEMIGGMVANLFFGGFYNFLFLFVFGGVITITTPGLTTGTGVGVLNAIEMGTFGMRQALDNVHMFHLLQVAFWGLAALIVLVIISNAIRKIPITLKGPGGLLKSLVVLVILGIAYALNYIIEPFHEWLYVDRLRGLYGVWIVAFGAMLVPLVSFIRSKVGEKPPAFQKNTVKYLVIGILVFLLTLQPEIYNGLDRVRIPVFTYIIIAVLCIIITWFQNTRLGQNMRTIGHDRAVATAAGINVDRTRIIAMMISTVLAAFGHLIFMQNVGVMVTYGGHEFVALYAVAALLVGGASVAKASIKHAVIGVIIFHAFFILAPFAGMRLFGSALIGEYFRMVVANAVIAFALIMHGWKRISKKLKVPGKNLIRGSSFLMLAGSIAGIVVAASGLPMAAHWDAAIRMTVPWAMIFGLTLVFSLYRAFYSIMGILYCNDLRKSGRLSVLGGLGILVAFPEIFLAFAMYNGQAIGVMTLIILLITATLLPIVYFVGTRTNVKADPIAQPGNAALKISAGLANIRSKLSISAENRIRASSILMLAGCILAVIVSVGGLAMAGLWDATAPLVAPWWIVYALTLVFALYRAFYSIMGIIFRKDLRRAGMLSALGGMGLIMSIVDVYLAVVVFRAGAVGLFVFIAALLTTVVLPIVFYSGALSKQREFAERYDTLT